MKPIVHKGDPTTTGGVVITGCDKAMNMGRPVARKGDKTTCPTCRHIGTIIEGDENHIIEGRPVALHLHLVACGCPLGCNRVLSSQNEAITM